MNKYILLLGLGLLFILPLASASVLVNITDFYTANPLANYSILVSTDANRTLPYNNVDNLTAWYQFDANNQTAPDSSGNGNTGTLSGWTFNNGTMGANASINSSGFFGNGLQLNETVSSSMSATYTQSLNLTNRSITYMQWIYPTTGNDMYIASSYGGNNKGWQIYRKADGSVAVNVATGSTTPGFSTSANVLPLNTWTHLAVVINTTGSYLYINGSFNFNSSGTNTTIHIDNPALVFGVASWDSNFRKGKGGWDEIRIWNISLNNAQILSELASPYPVSGSGLVISYSFDRNVSNIVYDTNNLVAGQINGSFNFGNGRTWVGVPTTLFQNTTQTRTLSAWFNINSLTSPGTQEIIRIRGASDTDLLGFQIAGGNVKGLFSNSTTSNFATTAYTPSINTWHMYTLAWNGTHVIYYVDGNVISFHSSINWQENSTQITLGSYDQSNNIRFYNGSIDDVRIYNTSLSADQISRLYQAGATRYYNYTSTNGNGTLQLPLSNQGQINMSFQSNANGGYYQLWAINHDTTLNYAKTMAQSENFFNATAKITGALITNVNFTTQYLTNTTHYMYVQTYNVTANGGNWYNKTISYTPVALVSTFNTTTGLYDWIWNATAKDFYTNTTISNFSVSVGNQQYNYSEMYNITNGTQPFALLRSLLYNITVNATDNGGYFSVTYLNVNLTSNNLVATPAQSINTFSATEKITNATLSGTFNTTFLTNATHYMRAQSYNLSAVVVGYPIQTIVYNATALSTGSYVFQNYYNWAFNVSAGLLYFATPSPVTYTFNNAQYGYTESVTTSGNSSINLLTSILYNVTINSTYSTGAVSIYMPNVNITNGIVIT